MRLPGVEDRTVVIGRTGSGKTYFGLWLLSEMPVDSMPWIIVDYKRDLNIAEIPYANEIDVGYMPTAPGVYIVRPLHDQDDEMTEYLYDVWSVGGIGLYIDEGMMLARNAALNTILIQGRSKQIPVIINTQRPVGVSRWVFTEASFFAVFPSHDKREQKVISEFTTLFIDKDRDYVNIPEFHSWWYDVKRHQLEKLRPVPTMNKIMQKYAQKLQPETETENVPAFAGGDQRSGFKWL